MALRWLPTGQGICRPDGQFSQPDCRGDEVDAGRRQRGEDAIERLASTDMNFALESKQQVERVLTSMESLNQQRMARRSCCWASTPAQWMGGRSRRTALQFQVMVSRHRPCQLDAAALDTLHGGVDALSDEIRQMAASGDSAALRKRVTSGITLAGFESTYGGSPVKTRKEMSHGDIVLLVPEPRKE